jgi:hypothetical protein
MKRMVMEKVLVGEDDEESFVICMALMERLSHDIVLKNALFTHTSRRMNRSSEITQLFSSAFLLLLYW